MVAAAAFARGIFNLTRTGIEQHGRPQAANNSPVDCCLVPRVEAPSIRACLGRHVRLAGRCPNNSSLHRPLAAVVVVAGPND